METDESGSTPVGVITRRRFLAVASAVAVAPLLPVGNAAVLGATPASPVDLVPPAVRPVPLSIGYVEGSAQWPRLDGLPWADDGVLALGRVVPANSLRVGDPALTGRSAIITVHGLVPDLDRLEGSPLRFIALDADLHADVPASALRFFAWTLRTGAAMSASGRSIFRMQVTQGTRLGFDLAVGSVDSNSLSSGHLGVASRDNVTALRRGAYLLALGPQTWDRARTLPARGDPAWSNLPSIVVTVDQPAA
jgi:hypothetical protein